MEADAVNARTFLDRAGMVVSGMKAALTLDIFTMLNDEISQVAGQSSRVSVKGRRAQLLKKTHSGPL